MESSAEHWQYKMTIRFKQENDPLPPVEETDVVGSEDFNLQIKKESQVDAVVRNDNEAHDSYFGNESDEKTRRQFFEKEKPNTCDDNGQRIYVKKIPIELFINGVESKNYHSQQEPEEMKIRKTPYTPAERMRHYRLRKKRAAERDRNCGESKIPKMMVESLLHSKAFESYDQSQVLPEQKKGRKVPLTPAEKMRNYRQRKKEAAERNNKKKAEIFFDPGKYGEYNEQREKLSEVKIERITVEPLLNLEDFENYQESEESVEHSLEPENEKRKVPLTPAEKMRNYRRRKREAAERENAQKVLWSTAGTRESNDERGLEKMLEVFPKVEKCRNDGQFEKHVQVSVSKSRKKKKPLTPAEKMRNYRQRKREAAKRENAMKILFSRTEERRENCGGQVRCEEQVQNMLGVLSKVEKCRNDRRFKKPGEHASEAGNREKKKPLTPAEKMRNYRERKRAAAERERREKELQSTNSERFEGSREQGDEI